MNFISLKQLFLFFLVFAKNFFKGYLSLFFSFIFLNKDLIGEIVEIKANKIPYPDLLQMLVTLTPGSIAYEVIKYDKSLDFKENLLLKIHVVEFSSDLIEFINSYLAIFKVEKLSEKNFTRYFEFS